MDDERLCHSFLGTRNDSHRMYVCMYSFYYQDALGVFLGQDNNQAPEALRIGWDELEDTFGDRLVMRTNEQTEYAMCAI